MWLHADVSYELTWWWEREATGEALPRGDELAARALFASVAAQPDLAPLLRSFLQQGVPGPVGPLDDADVVVQLAAAVASGRIAVRRLAEQALTSWGDEDEAEAAPAEVPRAEQEAPQEEVCWPCIMAAASARALREASAAGSPFVVQG